MAKAEKDKEDGILELFKTIFWALIIAGFIRTLFFQPFWIPTGSMKSTMLIGDFMFINKMAYGYSRHSCPFSMCPFSGRIWAEEPERGDIAVFKNPADGRDFIKRVIGLPGDKLQMREGKLFINDTEVPQVPTGTFEELYEPQGSFNSIPRCKNNVALGGTCVKDAATETLPNGKSYTVLNIVDGETGAFNMDNTPIYTVPPEHFFMMGDNRDNSGDSRNISRTGVGYVPFENFVGRADRIIVSSAGKRILFFWTWRPDRFFLGLN